MDRGTDKTHEIIAIAKRQIDRIVITVSALDSADKWPMIQDFLTEFNNELRGKDEKTILSVIRILSSNLVSELLSKGIDPTHLRWLQDTIEENWMRAIKSGDDFDVRAAYSEFIAEYSLIMEKLSQSENEDVEDRKGIDDEQVSVSLLTTLWRCTLGGAACIFDTTKLLIDPTQSFFYVTIIQGAAMALQGIEGTQNAIRR